VRFTDIPCRPARVAERVRQAQNQTAALGLEKTMSRISSVIFIAFLACAAQPAAKASDEPVVGGRCEGCEAVFVGLPASLVAQARIAPADEPGEPLHIEGSVFDAQGEPREGVIVYAYQTDARGVYPPATQLEDRWARRHGRLRAWARSDAQGRYAFDSVRPGSYPESRVPQHIHMHVIEPGCATYYIDDIEFMDDPLNTPESAQQQARARGGSGLVRPELREGVWQVRRDIHLGRGIPGYPSCSPG
jgi:protocatechuate 3,4-dioxygenase beta subunit